MERIIEPYERAVNSIASVNPFLAFSLSGKSHLQESLDRYFQSVLALFSTGGQSETEVDAETALRQIRESLVLDACADIEDDLLRTAQRISWWQCHRTRAFLEEQRQSRNQGLEKVLAEKLNQILPKPQ